MTTETPTRSLRLPWWASALCATLFAAAGAFAGGRWFPAAVAVGCLLAALTADRRAFFTVLAQPPLVTAAGAAGAAALMDRPLLGTTVELSASFPYLVATMVAVALVVTARIVVGRRAARVS